MTRNNGYGYLVHLLMLSMFVREWGGGGGSKYEQHFP